MKKFYLFSLLIIFSALGKAQELSINNLEDLLNKNSWQEVNRSFSGTKWEHSSSENPDSEYEKLYSWGYEKEYNSDKAVAWVSLFTHRSTPEMISYTIYQKDIFDNLQSRMKSSNYEKYDSEYEE